jgi:putative flippase GtrA
MGAKQLTLNDLTALLKKRLPLTARRFALFGAVGVIGFIVDALTLTVMMKVFGLGPVVARVFSIAAAMGATWLLNRRYTFAVRSAPKADEAARYAAVKLSGQVANFGIYTVILLAGPDWAGPYIALAAATILVMLLNFTMLSRFVFAPSKEV